MYVLTVFYNIQSFKSITYCLSLCRYQGKEGWAPASYLKKSDVSSQKMSSHSSANDLDGACKQISNKENQRERFSPFNDKKSAFKNLLDFFFFKKQPCLINTVH